MQEKEQIVLDYVSGRHYEIDFFDASHICIREFKDNPRCADYAYSMHYATEPSRVVAVFDATTEGLKDAKKLLKEIRTNRMMIKSPQPLT